MTISISKYRNFLKESNKEYNDEELEKMRDFFELLADIIYTNYQRKHNTENKNHHS